MKNINWIIGLDSYICVLFLAGCIDEHYGEDSNTIVTNLTGYAWGENISDTY